MSQAQEKFGASISGVKPFVMVPIIQRKRSAIQRKKKTFFIKRILFNLHYITKIIKSQESFKLYSSDSSFLLKPSRISV